MSKREEKREEGDDDDGDEDEDDISGSDGEDDGSGSDEEMSESESDGDSKATPGGGPAGKAGGSGGKSGSERALVNQPFDEALDLSESDSGSVSEGIDSPKKAVKSLKNMPFDEALELSGSVEDLESPKKTAAASGSGARKDSLPAGAERRGSDAGAAPGKANAAPSAGPSTAPSGAGSGAKATPGAPTVGVEMKNNPFDEEVDLSDSGDSVDTNGQPSPDRSSLKAKAASASAAAASASKQAAPAAVSTPASSSSSSAAAAATTAARRDDKPQQKAAPVQEERRPAPSSTVTTAAAAPKPAPMKQQPEKKAPEPKKHESESSSEESGSEEDDDDEEEEDDDEESQSQSAPTKGAGGAAGGAAGTSGATGQSSIMTNAGSYKESDFAHLKVSGEVRELFQYIGRFKSQEIELETRLKCFIPEYIPAVGDMDAFLKIPRPDGELDNLGLKMLDEPSLAQSDATVLDLQLRSTSKKKHGDIVVRNIENAEKAPKEIDRWVKSIADLHRTKPPPQVHYTKAMPDIESLMQVWPEEFEELLGKARLPSASMDMTLEQYVRVICALLDIPVHKNVYESLHVLFTLYLEFRSNQHFMNYDEQLEQQQQQQAPPPFSSRRGDSREMLPMVDDYGSSRK
ncbi:hypothetical protein PybrP1_010834 [[Pythium] brassicae (nom. inval.)]|nr:hypothetical protein PybrP1_010834 [[Pythium] brassicae (nom. inval.)]